MKTTGYRFFLTLFLMASHLAVGCAADTQKMVDAPGFRPEPEIKVGFSDHLGTAKLTVLPTVVRSREGTTLSKASQRQIVAYLKEKRWGDVASRDVVIDMGEPKGRAQFELFQNDLKRLGKTVETLSGESTYIVLEHLITPTPSGEIAVGGIHFYVLDAKGRNAFSFLLNSHHKIFVEAGLRAADSTAAGRERLITQATEAALRAFEQQVTDARAE